MPLLTLAYAFRGRWQEEGDVVTKYKKIFIALVLVVTVLCVTFAQPVHFLNSPIVSAAKNGSSAPELAKIEMGSTKKDGYDSYIAQYSNVSRPASELLIQGGAFAKAEGMDARAVSDFPGASGKAAETGETGTITWELDIPVDGLYNIAIRYYQLEGKHSSIDRKLLIDGKLPFAEANSFTFNRVWKNKGETIRDEKGNDSYTPQIEDPMWQEAFLQSSDGSHVDPYSFYFSKGKHSISLVSDKEPMMIDYIKLGQVDKVLNYQEVAAQYKEQGYKAAASGVFIKVQGEAASRKSNSSLYPVMDRSSAATEPYDISKIRMNTIGSTNWSKAGQWLAWDIDVPEDGLYKIGVKFNQNFARGITSYRKLTIDGKVPFEEMETVAFDFSNGWDLKELGDGEEPYQFYLTKGKHELRMEVSLGEMSDYVRTIESSILDLNTLYRRIVMVTGTVPDTNRDYQLELKLPEMVGTMTKQATVIEAISRLLAQATGGNSDRTATLDRLAIQLREMANNPGTVPSLMESFKTNISSLGTWIYQTNNMPLSIDYIAVASPEVKMPSASATLWHSVEHQVGTFFLSFFTDYNQLGSSAKTDKKITVWITLGMDQAKILKRMVEESFTPETGIAVDFQVVSEGILLQAMLAGRGPDVAFSVPNDRPVNYALRSGVEDISKYPGFEEVKKEFHESALVPYAFNGGYYALPMEQSFPVLFYRKDILDELKLKVPETWDDVYAILPELQKQNLLFGFPESSATSFSMLAMLLYQDDGEIYNDGGKTIALNSEKSIKSFIQWTDLYTSYQLPLTIDFTNRFRSGEMPIGIADYTVFQTISVTAPELRGLWEFAQVPGKKLPDGTVRHDAPGAGTATVMLKGSEHKSDAWDFMKWWASTDAQARFGLENEAILGTAGRLAMGNLDAMAQLPWQINDYKTLMEQWKWVKGIPEVPGGYFAARHIDNAFKSVAVSHEDPREAIEKFTRFINDEIKKKRNEFGLPN